MSDFYGWKKILKEISQSARDIYLRKPNIQQRISTLESEITQHKAEIEKHQQAIHQLNILIISKQGGIVELKRPTE